MTAFKDMQSVRPISRLAALRTRPPAPEEHEDDGRGFRAAAAGEEARFRTAVPRSWDAVWAVARHYHAKGYEVSLPPLHVRDSFEEREGHGDDCDLVVGSRWRFEIKWREREDFTCAEDFRFPTLFVDRAEKADLHAAGLTAYISVNRAMTHVAIIPAATREQWIKRERFDKVKGYPLTVYECPRELVRFEPLDRPERRA